jgi:L-asparaginase
MASDAPGVPSDVPTGLPTVAIITTGGTIASKPSETAGGVTPALSGAALLATVPALKSMAAIDLQPLVDIDSSQMTPEIWARLSQATDAALARDDIVGAVITHGTDTMAEGAYFLDVTLQSDKPVVFTGAMHNAAAINPDGPANIVDAVTQVLSGNARDWGVTVTLNGCINAARHVRKTHTTNRQTFMSGEYGYLGVIAGGAVTRFNDRRDRIRIPLPVELPETFPDVPLLAVYAGSDGRFIRHAVDSGANGLVIAGSGAGNINAASFDAVQYALTKGLPVVITSHVPNGAVRAEYANAGGGATLARAGAMLAGDLDGHKARLLLMLGLMQNGSDRAALAALFDRLH